MQNLYYSVLIGLGAFVLSHPIEMALLPFLPIWAISPFVEELLKYAWTMRRAYSTSRVLTIAIVFTLIESGAALLVYPVLDWWWVFRLMPHFLFAGAYLLGRKGRMGLILAIGAHLLWNYGVFLYES